VERPTAQSLLGFFNYEGKASVTLVSIPVKKIFVWEERTLNLLRPNRRVASIEQSSARLLFRAPRQGIFGAAADVSKLRASLDVVPPKRNPGFRLIPLHTLASLPVSERDLVLRTLPLVVAIRMALWTMSLRRVGRLLRLFERLPFSVPVDLPVSRLEWAVRAASRRVPLASCLTQALALQFLLTRTGRSSEIHIGVRNDAEAGFQSHAWVQCEGQLLLSTPYELAGYSRLLELEAWPD
jgi:hypothetical protein